MGLFQYHLSETTNLVISFKTRAYYREQFPSSQCSQCSKVANNVLVRRTYVKLKSLVQPDVSNQRCTLKRIILPNFTPITVL